MVYAYFYQDEMVMSFIIMTIIRLILICMVTAVRLTPYKPRRRRVWRFRQGPGEIVISGCLAPTPYEKFSPDFYVSHGPRWADQGVRHLSTLQWCWWDGRTSGVTLPSTWPGAAGVMAKSPLSKRPKTPMELPGEDWGGDPSPRQGMREREREFRGSGLEGSGGPDLRGQVCHCI